MFYILFDRNLSLLQIEINKQIIEPEIIHEFS